MSEESRRVLELDEKATEGPWYRFSSRCGTIQVSCSKDHGHHDAICAWTGFDASDLPINKQRNNAKLIAEYRTLAPQLARQVEALEAERDSLQQELSDSAKQIEVASAELLALSTNPPCRECGAMTEDEANTKCICAGDKDSCAGCAIWGD